MSRYERVDVRHATEPVGRMRVYGLSPKGRLAVVVVHEVTPDRVYYARRVRGVHGGLHRGWDLRSTPKDDWDIGVRGTCLAVRLPRISAVPMEVAR